MHDHAARSNRLKCGRSRDRRTHTVHHQFVMIFAAAFRCGIHHPALGLSGQGLSSQRIDFDDIKLKDTEMLQ